MVKRPLGASGLHVSEVAFGTWAIGGTDWGPVDDEESISALHCALDAGVNLIDTADFYGFGHAEAVVARALDGVSEEVFIATKGGLRWDEGGKDVRRDSSPAYLTQAVEASLRRLKRDAIDLYQIHWPDESVPVAESVGCLQRLREAGKIRHIGVSNYSPAQLKEAIAEGPIASLQMPYSLLDRRCEEALLPLCQAHGLGSLAYSPLAMGLLTGKYVAEQVFDEGDVRGWFPMFRGDTFRGHLKLVDELRPIAQGEAKSLAQLAIRWVLANPAVTTALVGARRPSQVAEDVGAAGWTLSDRARAHLQKILGP